MKKIMKKSFYSILGFIFTIQTGIARAVNFWNNVVERQISQVWVKEVSVSQQFSLNASIIVTAVSMIVVPLGLLIGLIVIIVTWKDKEKRKLGLKILLWSIFIPIFILLIIWIISSLIMYLQGLDI